MGSGTRFLSGISYYTDSLSCALADCHGVLVILMRELIPRPFYPGRLRVGKDLAHLTYEGCEVVDGVDWPLIPSVLPAIRALRDQKPDVVVFEWWTGAVLHAYILLAFVARALGARVVVEFHEVLDTAEERMPAVRRYVRLASTLFTRMVSGYVVHSRSDLPAVRDRFQLGGLPYGVIAHGPYDRYASDVHALKPGAEDGPMTLLYFGVLRPYKGVDVLLQAFDSLPAEEARRYQLLIVGETWEGWDVPAQMIARSPYRDRIEFVNRYVLDAEVASFFARADGVMLPYRRSSASGPLSIAMSWGLPVAVSAVGGIPEAVADYTGAVLMSPEDVGAVREAFARLRTMRGSRHTGPHSWEQTVRGFNELFDRIHVSAAVEDVLGDDVQQPRVPAWREVARRMGTWMHRNQP